MLTLASCTGEDEAGSLEDRLRDMAGVQDASVGPVSVDQDQSENLVVVDAEADVSADELAAVVEEIADSPPEDEDPGSHPWSGVVYVGAGTTEWASPADAPASGLWLAVERLEDAPARAGLLVAAHEAFPEARVAVEPDLLRVELDSEEAGAVAAAAADIAADDALGEARGVEVVARHDGSPVARLSTSRALDRGLVETWQALLATRDLAPEVTTTSVSLDLRDTGRIETSIRMPAGAPARTGADGYDDRLRPMLEAQLALLEDLPEDSALEVTLERASGPDDPMPELDELLEVRKGERLPE